MINIGAHLSISKGFTAAAKTAVAIDSNTFQYFPRNPRGGAIKKLDEEDVKGFFDTVKINNLSNILSHAPYTYNLSSNKEDVRRFARAAFREDLERLEFLPVNLYNLHPGSHTGNGIDIGIEYIVDMLNDIITDDITSTVLLETMSGKGSEIGSTFEELARIIDGVRQKDKMGVCMDSCHLFSAGYDIVNDLDGVLEEFDKVIGLDKLKGIHLNDSMKPFSENKDRHAGIGEGLIGLDPLISLITHPKLKRLPFYLETPFEVEGHKREIKLIKKIIWERGISFE
ncbi:MAG: Apurinic endonuclease (APN1) [Clostridiales bacterium 38_11]|nr:MAG: Apurinic endonuclease (APN1) [Clostridiales bacterium 38_11]HBH12079.1 endonuclease IV [Clostridiales bacterium]